MGALDRVTAAELVRNFGVWQSRALHAPVVVTHRGRETHLLTPYREDAPWGESPAGDWSGLLDEIAEAVVVIDADYRIVRTNRAAGAAISALEASSRHAPLREVIPGFADGLVARYLARTLRTGEGFAGDLPSPLSRDGWLRIKLVRSGDGAALIFRDVTAELVEFTGADTTQGTIRSFAALGNVGHARLSVRGMIEDVDANLRDRIGASGEALRRVAFASLLPLRQRARFHEAFEDAMRSGASGPLETELVGRTGETVAACLGLSRVSGPYAVEGAVVAVSWSLSVTPPCAAPPSPH